MESSSSDLHPIAILVDELRSEDLTLRLNAIHRVSAIALALGEERTRDELLPFLHESLDDDDEILLALAQELGENFVEYVGGPAHAHLILVVLESLAAVEETLVREKAAESITKLCQVLSPSQIQEHYVPLVRRLSTGDWFTSRTSATALFAAGYSHANAKTQEDLRALFSALCSDDTPMVRRAAAKELGGFSKTLSHDALLNDLMPTFRKLAQDDQDSVRLLTVDALIAIAEALSDEECKTYLGATMKSMVSDKSWRVRYMVAEHFVKLAAAAGQDIVREELVAAFVLLIKDNEAEVRTAAAGQIPGVFVLPSRFLFSCLSLSSFSFSFPLPSSSVFPSRHIALILTHADFHAFCFLSRRIRQARRSRDHPRSSRTLHSRSPHRYFSARSSRPWYTDFWTRSSPWNRSYDHGTTAHLLAAVEG